MSRPEASRAVSGARIEPARFRRREQSATGQVARKSLTGLPGDPAWSRWATVDILAAHPDGHIAGASREEDLGQ
jgi:hypothetical protein